MAHVQGVQVGRLQEGHGVGDGVQVIQQADGREVQRLPQLCLLHHPGQVGDGGPAGYHRTGYAKTGPLYGQAADFVVGQELTDDRFQAGIVGAGEGRLGQRRPGAVLGRENGQVGLGSTNVTGK